MALFRNFLRDGLPFVCAAALILASQRTEGQVPSGQTQDRAQLLGGQANPTVPNVTPSGENQGYAVASPNEKDIGEQQILKRMEEYRPFTVSVYSPFFWTSNVALVSSGEEDDFVVAPGVASETIMTALRQRIDAAFLPRPLCFVESLPRNETGKLPRMALDDLVARLAAKAG